MPCCEIVYVSPGREDLLGARSTLQPLGYPPGEHSGERLGGVLDVAHRICSRGHNLARTATLIGAFVAAMGFKDVKGERVCL